jgi:hypothetical protein
MVSGSTTVVEHLDIERRRPLRFPQPSAAHTSSTLALARGEIEEVKLESVA